MPFSHTLYPHFCKSFQLEPRRAFAQLRRLAGWVLGITFAGASIICISAPRFVPLYLGRAFANSVGVLQILIFSICAISVSQAVAIDGLLAASLSRDYLRVVVATAVLSLPIAPCSILLGGARGLAISAVALETFCAVYGYTLLRRAYAGPASGFPLGAPAARTVLFGVTSRKGNK
jgi:O-antigen/teichoic acid export membrane protein